MILRSFSTGTATRSRVTDQVSEESAARLLRRGSFLAADGVDTKVPDLPGLYAIRIQNPSALPNKFAELSMRRGHDLLYIGIASKSLKKRFLGQELRARGHGTFFRSIGAVLGLRPEQGSLVGRSNPRNYAFGKADEQTIIAWINQNLLVNWIELPPEKQHDIEKQLITDHIPLLNLRGNPAALPELSAVRAECVTIANTPA